MQTAVLTCGDIQCDACAAAIKRVLGKLNPAGSVSVDVPSKSVHIEFDEALLTLDAFKQRLTAAGFPPD